MANGSQTLTTYYAKRIIGDTGAASATSALLQIGNGVTTDTWILHKTGRATEYGIKYYYDYADSTEGDTDKIEFVGKGSTTAYVELDTGNATFPKVTGDLIGNADTATKWKSAQKVYVTLGTPSTTTEIQGGDSSAAQTIGVNGTLKVTNGGTGTNTAPTQWGIIYASTTAKYASTGAGTNGALLECNATSAPTWKASANGAVYATSANGDLQWGTLPVGQGGTNKTSWTQWGIVYASATDTLNQITAGAAANATFPLISKGAAAPNWYDGLALSGTQTSDYLATFSGSIKIDNNTARKHIEFVRTTTDSGPSYICYPSTGELGIGFNTGYDNIVALFNNLAMKPGKDLTYDLGDSTHRWSDIYTNVLRLQGAASNPSLSAGARIEFTYDDSTNRSQPVVISYTPNDSYRSPAGLKILGGTSATPAWFEVEGHLYAGHDDSTSERDVVAESKSGQIYLYSTGNSNGNGTRGLSVTKKGTNGIAFSIITIDTNSNTTFKLYNSSTAKTLSIVSGAAVSNVTSGDRTWTLPQTAGNRYFLGTSTYPLTTNGVFYASAISDIAQQPSANGALFATEDNGTLSWGTLPTAQGGTGSTEYTATRLLYTSTATTFASTTITSDGTYLGQVSYLSINTAHQTDYKLYVNGTSYFFGNTTHKGIVYFANGTTYYVDASAKAYLGQTRLDYLTINAAHQTNYRLYVSGTTYASGVITVHDNIKADRAGYGLYLIDSTAAEYAGIYDNGSNLWIGATSSGGNHHHGNLYLSAGYTDTTANKSIYISIPKSGGHTAYALVYKDKTGSATKGIYTDADGKTAEMTYSLNATVPVGAKNVVPYYSAANTLSTIATANGALYATSANGNPAWGTLPTGQGGTGNTSYTANRLVWTETATKFTAGYHYASSTKVGICYTSEPSYNFAVNGTSYFNGSIVLKANQYYSDSAGINMQNSDIYNINSIRFNDVADAFNEGIMFYRSAGAWECIAANSSGFFFRGGTDGTPALSAANANGTIFASVVWGEKVRICSNWVGFYSAAGDTTTRYGYVQANADRMYFRKENGVSSYGFDFNSHLYTTGNYYAVNNGPCYICFCQDFTSNTSETNGLSANREQGMVFYNKNGTNWLGDFKQGYTQSNGQMWSRMYLRNYKTDGTNVNNYIYLYANKDGTTSYAVANKAAFRSAISAKAIQTAKTDPSASGSGITYIATISQNTEGVITATKSTVRDASASQSGVVSTGAQTFAGVKTFNSKITGNISGHADSDLALSGGTMTGDIKGNSSVALGTTANPFHNIVLGGTTNATMTASSANPRITFQEGTGTQPVHLIYTDYDSYRSPAGLKVIGGTDATPAWFEVEGDLYCRHGIGTSTASSWLDGQRYNNGGWNLTNATNTGSYWPWMRQTNTSSAKWFSFGTLNTSFYWIGSATSRTDNSYDYGMYFNVANGYLQGAARIYSAVWNDFAEMREADETEPGRVIARHKSSEHMIKTTERLQPAAKIISDTYGQVVGQSDTAKTPIGVAGRVLVYPYQDKKNYKIGDALCAAPNGTADIMTREEIILYPDRIIGIVDEIPDYEVWEQTLTHEGNGAKNTNHVQVKGRIWIYVR